MRAYVFSVNHQRANLERPTAGDRAVREDAPPDAVRRFEHDEVHGGLGEPFRAGEARHPRAYDDDSAFFDHG
jgi:hypothetical protein